MTDAAYNADEVIFTDDIEAFVIRKRIKNLIIKISDIDGSVCISAPKRCPKYEISAFIHQKRHWIKKQQMNWQKSVKAYFARISESEYLALYNHVSSLVPAMVEFWEEKMGVKANTISYKDMISEWGSCNVLTGNICINIRLGLYSDKCLEYVVVHELCHLIEPGHGTRYTYLMDMYLPNWKFYRDLLK